MIQHIQPVVSPTIDTTHYFNLTKVKIEMFEKKIQISNNLNLLEKNVHSNLKLSIKFIKFYFGNNKNILMNKINFHFDELDDLLL